MKNEKRAKDIKNAIKHFIETDEAHEIFEAIAFKNNDRDFHIGDIVSIDVHENNGKQVGITIRNNSQNGFREYKGTFEV